MQEEGTDELSRFPQRSTRRDFCASVCHAASLIAVGSVIPACGGSPTSPSSGAPSLAVVNASVANGAVVVNIDATSPLASVGGAALVQSSARTLLVAHTGQDAFTALTAMCTHEACTVTGFQSGHYVCPCHGSQYSTSGQVLSGPAPRALQQFPAQFANGTLTITV